MFDIANFNRQFPPLVEFQFSRQSVVEANHKRIWNTLAFTLDKDTEKG